MPTVTYAGNTYTCTKALKGSNFIKLFNDAGVIVASFEGISNFNSFSISGGSWVSPKASTECPVALVQEDGSTGACGVPLKNFLKSNEHIVLTANVQYGSSLPSSGSEGQLFFLLQ